MRTATEAVCRWLPSSGPSNDHLSEPAQIGEVGAAYAGCRQRITALVEGIDDEVRRRTVPACPDWRVHDLVAHVAGVVDDVMAGRLEGGGTDPWTAKQVEARRDRPTAEVLGEWNHLAPQLEAILDSFGAPGRQGVMDVVTHEHDLRGALGSPGSRDSDAVLIGAGWIGEAITRAAAAAGHPVIRLCTTDGRQWTGGSGEPVATLTATPFELLRACSGRRSSDEIRALDWVGEVDAVLPAFTFGPFTPRTAALDE